MTFMSASQKLIINEDLTALLCAWQLPTTVHMHSICSIYNTQATYVFHCIYPWCDLRFKTVSTSRQFHSNCLFIQAMNVSIWFLKLLFTRVRSRVQAQHVVCVDSARWRLPPCSTTSCSAGSSIALCTFLIQHLWVVSWPASLGTWTRVSLDLSWLWTFSPGELSVGEVTLVDKV